MSNFIINTFDDIESIRKEIGVNKHEMAEAMDVSYNTYLSYCRGETSPTLDKVALAKRLFAAFKSPDTVIEQISDDPSMQSKLSRSEHELGYKDNLLICIYEKQKQIISLLNNIYHG